MKGAIPACLLALALAAPPAIAQYEEDDRTSDYEDQDRRYYERYNEEKKKEQEAQQQAVDPAQAAAEFLERAERLVRDRNYRSHSSSTYHVQSDDPRVDPNAAVALLDEFRLYFDAFWKGHVELDDYDEVSRVFLFYSFHKFNQLLAGDFRFSELRPKGHYGWLFDVITLHSDSGDEPGSLADALVHEAAHQLVDRRLFTAGHAPPIWLSEGLASYFGYTYLNGSGEFERGEVGGKSVALLRGASAKPGREGERRLKALRKALKSAGDREFPPVLEVIAVNDPARFYGTDTMVSYGVSWLLVHYLLHGEQGRLAEPFARYLVRAAAGDGGPIALLAELDVEPEELQGALERHAKRIKSR